MFGAPHPLQQKIPAMRVEPYLMFFGRCEEALAFYQRAIDAKLQTLMRFKDNPEPEKCPVTAGLEQKVMHASLKIGDARVMLSDGMCGGRAEFKGISLSISVADAATADRYFDALGEGGKVQMPIGPTFFSPRFGMVADRFGVSWMVVVGP